MDLNSTDPLNSLQGGRGLSGSNARGGSFPISWQEILHLNGLLRNKPPKHSETGEAQFTLSFHFHHKQVWTYKRAGQQFTENLSNKYTQAGRQAHEKQLSATHHRGVQVKTTVWHPLSPTEWLPSNSQEAAALARMETLEPLHGAGGNARDADAGETRTEPPSQEQTELPRDPASPSLGMHPKEFKAGSRRRARTPTLAALTAALLDVSPAAKRRLQMISGGKQPHVQLHHDSQEVQAARPWTRGTHRGPPIQGDRRERFWHLLRHDEP